MALHAERDTAMIWMMIPGLVITSALIALIVLELYRQHKIKKAILSVAGHNKVGINHHF